MTILRALRRRLFDRQIAIDRRVLHDIVLALGKNVPEVLEMT